MVSHLTITFFCLKKQFPSRPFLNLDLLLHLNFGRCYYPVCSPRLFPRFSSKSFCLFPKTKPIRIKVISHWSWTMPCRLSARLPLLLFSEPRQSFALHLGCLTCFASTSLYTSCRIFGRRLQTVHGQELCLNDLCGSHWKQCVVLYWVLNIKH